MNFYRVLAVARRYGYEQRRNASRLAELFYWPLVDIFIWGLTSGWHQKMAKDDAPILITMLTCILLWQILWRSNQAIAMGLVAEIWDKNLGNLFSTPLTISEWTVGVMLVGIGQTCIAGCMGYLVALFFFDINLLTIGPAIIPLVLGVIVFGWIVGILSTAVVLKFGNGAVPLLWMFASLSAPFSGVYFPTSMLPEWTKIISYMLPSSYLFEGARGVLRTGVVPTQQLYVGSVLNILYLLAAFYLLLLAFRSRQVRGLHHSD